MRTVLITGANRGIGLEHARRYAERGITVFAACRDPGAAAELKTLAMRHPGMVTVIGYDATDPGGPSAVRAAIGAAPIDLLFNNAGVDGRGAATLGAIDSTAFMTTLAVNALAPLRLAEALADAVAAFDRRIIANQSSLMGSIADSSGGSYAYRASKAALNMITKGLALDLKARGVTVVTMHPGWVRTRMGGPGGKLSVEESAAGQQEVLDRLTPAQSGMFFNYDGKPLPW
jgi:NAD(P)-dependent dehydrogenase (short-subunit alcohol dehydrogenase family)